MPTREMRTGIIASSRDELLDDGEAEQEEQKPEIVGQVSFGRPF